ncbi:MAG: virulence protein RhuM/Fic/DOC family protein [Candidatus Omnitrophota bacterium]
MKNRRDENVGANKGEIAIYKAKSGSVRLDVKLENETVWLSLNQVARLFDRDKSVISRHISNIFREKELDSRSTVANFATVQIEGARRIERLIECYNLDIIISVGYRVNSKRATQFRIWATNVLRNYLIRGYALNQKRLLGRETALKDLQETIAFISGKTVHPQLTGKGDELLKLLNEYANALTILNKYDSKSLSIAGRKTPTFILTYEHAHNSINDIKSRLCEKGEATELFGQETSHKFKSIIGALYQTFDRKDLYRSIEEKAANLLYLTIKDHPFSDGNKRIASLLFIYYLEKNSYLRKVNGERKINDNAIVALSLLIAASDPREKDVMIKIITNLLKE